MPTTFNNELCATYISRIWIYRSPNNILFCVSFCNYNYIDIPVRGQVPLITQISFLSINNINEATPLKTSFTQQ